MKTHEREIRIYYDPTNSTHRQTVTHARSHTPHVTAYAFKDAPSTTTSWRQIIMSLGKHPRDLMNKAHPYYQEHIRDCDFDDDCWLNVLSKNPELFRSPIALRGSRAVLCETPTDVYRLGDMKV